MKLEIREAGVDDAVLIADISRKTFYDAFAADNTEADMNRFMNEQFTRGKLILEVGRAENIFLLASNQTDIVGYVKLREAKTPEKLGDVSALEIARLYVIKEKIGSGAGKALMEASLQIAINKGKEVVWLGVWEKNERAINFYRKWGFEKFGETDFLLGDDLQKDWLMWRKVDRTESHP